MTTKLEKIIQQAYKTFENYRVPTSLEVCKPHCLTFEEEKSIISAPLQTLSIELLSMYNDSTKSEFQNADELKYFLPRMLEVIAQHQFPSSSSEICLQRIGMVKKEDWKNGEFEVIKTFAEEFFKDCLSLHPSFKNSGVIASVLIMFYKAKVDPQPLLDMWLQQDTCESLLWYCDMVLYRINRKRDQSKLINSFADKTCSEIVTHFLFDTKTKKHFAARIEQTMVSAAIKDKDDVEMINYAYELLV